MELKEKIIEATIEEFNEKNLKFTMDDIAKKLCISKKTIYDLFKNKEALFFEVIDHYSETIREYEMKIIQDPDLDIKEKLKKIIISLPDNKINWRQIYLIKEKSPEIYDKVTKMLETQWEPTIELLEMAIKENKIISVSIPILKTTISSTIRTFISTTLLSDNNIEYEEALKEMADIIMNGIEVK